MSLENGDEKNIINEKNISKNSIKSNSSNPKKNSEQNSNYSDSGSESESENISKKNSLNISTSNNNEIQEKINTNLNLSLSEEKKDYEILRDYKDKSDFNFKAILIGNPFVGKSSLINKAVKNKFDFNYAPTLGFDYFFFHIRIKNKIISLQIWDTCGQEIYLSLVTNFYRNSSVAFMVYAINDRKSFEDLNNWLKEIKYKSNPDVKIFLIGNKCDLTEERKVTYEEAEQYSKNYEFNGFCEASAKTGEKAEEIMIKAAQILYDDFTDYLSDKTKKNGDYDLTDDDKSSKKLSASVSSRGSRNQDNSFSGKKCC